MIKTTTSTEIDTIISALSAVWHIPDPIEETSDHQFFSSFINHSRVHTFFLLIVKIIYLLIITSPPHQDTLYQINYRHLPSSVPIFVHFCSHPFPL